jgi:protoheme IX farnesyltransferase
MTADHPFLAPSPTLSLASALLRLSKPGIVLAELLAALAGMLLAAPATALASINVPTLFAITFAAGGAAMFNNLLDASVDRKMARLAPRCRALKAAGPRRVLIIALSLMGGGLLLASLNAPLLTVILLAVGCLSYLWLYTAWLKRSTPWGVLAGALPGALPPLIGASAVSGTLDSPDLLLALIVFLWQLPHFWFLALQCREQYAQAGIPVLPLTHGEVLTKRLTLAMAFLLIPVTLLLGLSASLSALYFVVAAVAGLLFFLLCAHCLYWSQAYQQGFIASLVYLLIIVGAIAVEFLLLPGPFK